MWDLLVVVGVLEKNIPYGSSVSHSLWVDVSCRVVTPDSGAVRIPFCHYSSFLFETRNIMRTFFLGTVRYGTETASNKENTHKLYVLYVRQAASPATHTKD